MTASLLFSQAPYQTQPPDIERGMIGGSGLNHSVVSKTYDESSGNRRGLGGGNQPHPLQPVLRPGYPKQRNS
jgi:hypothetical protein